MKILHCPNEFRNIIPRYLDLRILSRRRLFAKRSYPIFRQPSEPKAVNENLLSLVLYIEKRYKFETRREKCTI